MTLIEEILGDSALLGGRLPEEIESAIGAAAGWRVERLGQGWVLRQDDEDGRPTGRVIRWHPGGGRHGHAPYWRVSSPEGGKSQGIR